MGHPDIKSQASLIISEMKGGELDIKVLCPSDERTVAALVANGLATAVEEAVAEKGVEVVRAYGERKWKGPFSDRN